MKRSVSVRGCMGGKRRCQDSRRTQRGSNIRESRRCRRPWFTHTSAGIASRVYLVHLGAVRSFFHPDFHPEMSEFGYRMHSFVHKRNNTLAGNNTLLLIRTKDWPRIYWRYCQAVLICSSFCSASWAHCGAWMVLYVCLVESESRRLERLCE